MTDLPIGSAWVADIIAVVTVVVSIIGGAFAVAPWRASQIDLVRAGQSANRCAAKSTDERTCSRVAGSCTDDRPGSGTDQSAGNGAITGIRSASCQQQCRHRQCCN